jgi:hypothetical protein
VKATTGSAFPSIPPDGIKNILQRKVNMSNTMPQDCECHISVNLLLEAAYRLFCYDKVPLALTLIHEVLQQYPEHPNARKYFQEFTGKSAPVYPVNRNHRMHYDSDAEKYVVTDKISGKTSSFKTFEEAEKYLRGVK